ncbi:MAG TPA: hypothetical protein VL021_05790 [Brumimicrobium sp.]|nr:hypothetical protein [Brumimicrobium sp.]
MKRANYNYLLLVFLFALFSSSSAFGQDIEKLKDEKPFTISGGVGAGATFFHSNQAFKHRDPFAWRFNAHLTPTVYGFSFPFSVVITQFSKSYQAPFTQIGISPTYKWASLHLGYRHLSLSPLVFQGSSFLGVGIELKPKMFQFSAFYGRLNKAIAYDQTIDQSLMPQYSRIGWGGKIGVGTQKQNFSLQFFRGKDDKESINLMYDPDDPLSRIAPQDNSVLGTSWRFLILKRLSFTGDLAVGLISQDIKYDYISEESGLKIPKFVKAIAPPNYSSVLSYSGQTMLGLSLKKFYMSLGYKRVGPDFVSLGVPYAINDIQMFSGTMSTQLLKNKISLNLTGNHQENNLDKKRATSIQTNMGNLNVNANINENWNLNVNTTVVYVYQKDGLLALTDSTRMNQLMTSLNISPTYSIGGEQYMHSAGLNLSFTDLNDNNTATQEYTDGSSYNGSMNYNITFNRHSAGALFILNYSKYIQTHHQYQSVGLNVGGNIQLLKTKSLSLNGMIGYYFNKSSSFQTGNNTTFSLNCSYRLKKHAFGLFTNYTLTPPVNLNPLDDIYKVPYAVNSRIFSGGINYSYSF